MGRSPEGVETAQWVDSKAPFLCPPCPEPTETGIQTLPSSLMHRAPPCVSPYDLHGSLAGGHDPRWTGTVSREWSRRMGGPTSLDPTDSSCLSISGTQVNAKDGQRPEDPPGQPCPDCTTLPCRRSPYRNAVTEACSVLGRK